MHAEHTSVYFCPSKAKSYLPIAELTVCNYLVPNFVSGTLRKVFLGLHSKLL